MKIAVIGPGALGCLLAGRFFGAGAEVCLVDYRPERAAFLQERGIIFIDLDGSRAVRRIPVVLPEGLKPADLSIVTVKAGQTSTAAQDLPALMAGGGIALTLQNGLGNLEQMAAVTGPRRLLAGVTFLGATQPAAGEVIFAGQGTTIIGAPKGSLVRSDELAAVAELFRRAGLACQIRDDIDTVLWEKLIVNVGINPLTAILRVRNGALPEIPEAWKLAVAAASEAVEVARASGMAPAIDPEKRLKEVCTATAANRSSMLQDILAGRPTEIDALNGQVTTRGAALGVPTPVNSFLTAILKALEQASPLRVN
ncbi:MAG: 2-dehydropantoate 2-reductase [Deltaproteobacteria bacterium]|nr:2-dehydropantoate 2-reductase [Deltaproteobacteria bacterium]